MFQHDFSEAHPEPHYSYSEYQILTQLRQRLGEAEQELKQNQHDLRELHAYMVDTVQCHVKQQNRRMHFLLRNLVVLAQQYSDVLASLTTEGRGGAAYQCFQDLHHSIMDALEYEGVATVNPAIGSTIEPAYFIAADRRASAYPENAVLEVLQPAYCWNSLLLMPGKVIVAAPPSPLATVYADVLVQHNLPE